MNVGSNPTHCTGLKIPNPGFSHVIARSPPGDIKAWGLAVLVAIGGGMFLTQLVETELPVPEGTSFRVIRKCTCSSR